MEKNKKSKRVATLFVISLCIIACIIIVGSYWMESKGDDNYKIIGVYGPPYEEQNIYLIMNWKNTLLTPDKVELWNATQTIYPRITTSRWYFSDSGYIVLLGEKEKPPTKKEMDAIYTIWNATAVNDGVGSLPLKFEIAPLDAYQYIV